MKIAELAAVFKTATVSLAERDGPDQLSNFSRQLICGRDIAGPQELAPSDTDSGDAPLFWANVRQARFVV